MKNLINKKAHFHITHRTREPNQKALWSKSNLVLSYTFTVFQGSKRYHPSSTAPAMRELPAPTMRDSGRNEWRNNQNVTISSYLSIVGDYSGARPYYGNTILYCQVPGIPMLINSLISLPGAMIRSNPRTLLFTSIMVLVYKKKEREREKEGRKEGITPLLLFLL